MEERPSQIVAFGGGGFSMDAGNPLLDDYVLRPDRGRAPARVLRADGVGRRRPLRRALLPHLRGLRLRAQPPLALPPRPHRRRPATPASTCSSRTSIYVGGGIVISLLGAWRAHGIDVALAEAWRRGVVLCGLSAGSLCWFSRGGHRLPRRAAGGRGARAAAALQLRALRRRAVPAPGVPRASSATACAPATRPTTAPRCTSSAPTCTASWPRGPGKRGWRVALRGDRVVERKLPTVDLGAPLALVA